MNNNMFWREDYGNPRPGMQMNGQMGGYPQNTQPMSQMFQPEMFIVRSVSSPEEALATPGDYFKTTIILGVNHGVIYIKKFNTETGSMDVKHYKLCPEMANDTRYLMVGEFQEFKGQLEGWLQKISEIRKQEVAENE